MALSTAVGTERVSRITGWALKKGNFQTTAPNLPQRIAILGEPTTALSGTISLTPRQILTAQEAGTVYGFGSPIHSMARILLPVNGGGVGGVPVVVYPQQLAGSSTARTQTITITGTATGNGTHFVQVAGRTILDGGTYDVNIVTGDTAAAVATKVRNAIQGVLGSPVSAAVSTNVVTVLTKWTGLTAQGVNIAMLTGLSALGLTYTIAETTTGSGTPDVTPALNLFGSNWNTIVVNGYGAVSAVMDALETFNGIPDPETPTGRFTGTIWKPLVAVTGSLLDDPTTITDARLNNVTIALAPAPLSAGLAYEAAANMTVLHANRAQNNPHLDVQGLYYPDMPAATGTPAMTAYTVRDAAVKKGSSTVDYIAGRYQVQDYVTTYHPVGEVPPQFRYVRNLVVDDNMRFAYYLLEQLNVVDHVIASDDDIVMASNVIKPKQWKQVVSSLADDLEKKGLITDSEFMKSSIQVAISSTNPDRLETAFRYKRSGTVRIASTTAEAGFNFGSGTA